MKSLISGLSVYSRYQTNPPKHQRSFVCVNVVSICGWCFLIEQEQHGGKIGEKTITACQMVAGLSHFQGCKCFFFDHFLLFMKPQQVQFCLCFPFASTLRLRLSFIACKTEWNPNSLPTLHSFISSSTAMMKNQCRILERAAASSLLPPLTSCARWRQQQQGI